MAPQTAFRVTAFLLLTYGSLQVAAFVRCKRWLRAAAALPLIVMIPIIIVGANPHSHRDGSLYGLVIYFPYLPVMIYLAAVLGVSMFVTSGKRRAAADTTTETTGTTPAKKPGDYRSCHASGTGESCSAALRTDAGLQQQWTVHAT